MTSTQQPGGARPARDRSGLGRLLRRITSSSGELADEDLQRRAVKEGARPISECEDRETVLLRGYLASVTVNPQSGNRWLEAEFTDGSGSVTLIWMGRRTIPGIDAGRHLRVSGRISFVDGRRTLYNPHYELLS